MIPSCLWLLRFWIIKWCGNVIERTNDSKRDAKRLLNTQVMQKEKQNCYWIDKWCEKFTEWTIDAKMFFNIKVMQNIKVIAKGTNDTKSESKMLLNTQLMRKAYWTKQMIQKETQKGYWIHRWCKKRSRNITEYTSDAQNFTKRTKEAEKLFKHRKKINPKKKIAESSHQPLGQHQRHP